MKELDYIKKEITAGMVLFPATAEDTAWNNASKRAISIIEGYKEGRGLFQLGEENDRAEMENRC